MSYTPTEWKTGDVIPAEKLNNMEDGIQKAGSVYPVRMTYVMAEGAEVPTVTLQKTFGEIKSAVEYGSVVIIVGSIPEVDETSVMYLIPEGIQINSGGGIVGVNGNRLIATTDNDYPTNSGK